MVMCEGRVTGFVDSKTTTQEEIMSLATAIYVRRGTVMEFNKKKVTDFRSNNAIVILLVLLVLFVGFTRKGFFSGPNYSNIITNVTPRFIIALGVSGCLITQGTDLSAGRMVGFGGVIACTLLQRPDYTAKFFANLPQMPLVVVLLIVMLITAFFGLLVNGCVVAYLKVPPFLATLGMQTIVFMALTLFIRARIRSAVCVQISPAWRPTPCLRSGSSALNGYS